jgi:hypothetical protein
MVTLDYRFNKEELKKLDGFDFDGLTLTDLDYYLFCGDIFFRVNGVSLDAPWGWIPIFNFCIRMNFVLSDLQSRGRALLEFTENDATIVFDSQDSSVAIRADYANAFARCNPEELRNAVTAFSEKLLREMVAKWPKLPNTSAFQERCQTIRSTISLALTF